MSYILHTTPQVVAPVYNPAYITFGPSANIAQPNFTYYIQLFTGATTTGVPISVVNLLPRPITGGGIYNPSRVLESYVSYDKNIQNITAATGSNNVIMEYTADFGESYGLLSTGTTIYSGTTSFTGYIFNGVLQYEQIPTWNPNPYLIQFQSPVSLFLTNQPRSGVYVKNSTDRGSLSYMDLTPADINNGTNQFGVQVFHANGSNTVTYYWMTGVTANSGYIPSGPWNINNIPASQRVAGGTGTTIDVNNDTKYRIFVNNSFGLNVSEFITYVIDTSCNKYTTVRVQFLNRLGGWDYFNFNLVSKKTIDITRNTYKKVLPYNYSIGDRQTTIIDMDGTLNYELNSDWVGDATSTWLEELVTSNEIYMIDSNGNARPVQMVENSVEVKKQVNEKLFNYTYNFTSSYELNTQRG